MDLSTGCPRLRHILVDVPQSKRESHAQTMLFMTWPQKSNTIMFVPSQHYSLKASHEVQPAPKKVGVTF